MALPHKIRPNSSVPAISQQLRTLAMQKAPHEKLPTLSDLCELLGTSRATLVEALDELEMQHVIYRQPSKGIFVSPLIYRKTVCLLLDSNMLQLGNSSFWAWLWGACARHALERTDPYNEYYIYHMISSTPGQEPLMPEEIMHMVASQRIHGFISIGLRSYIPELLKRPLAEPKTVAEVITQSGLPCVTFANYGRWTVGLDSHDFLSKALQRLIEQGCQRISLWQPFSALTDCENRDRASIFALLLNAHQRPFDPSLVVDITSFPHTDEHTHLPYLEQGYKVALHMFGQDTPIRADGIVMADDTFMEGVSTATRQLGIPLAHMPKIATHANSGSLRLYERTPNISVIEYDINELTHALFSSLHLLLNNEEADLTALENIKPRYRTGKILENSSSSH